MPLSPLLFSLCLDLVCLSIVSCNAIHGYFIQNVEVRILAYSDDIAVFCTDKTSVSEVAKTTKSFCEASGAVVNWKKC